MPVTIKRGAAYKRGGTNALGKPVDEIAEESLQKEERYAGMERIPNSNTSDDLVSRQGIDNASFERMLANSNKEVWE